MTNPQLFINHSSMMNSMNKYSVETLLFALTQICREKKQSSANQTEKSTWEESISSSLAYCYKLEQAIGL